MFVSLLKAPAVCERTRCKTAYLYRLIGKGLMVPPVKVGIRAVAWPDSEISAWVAARIRGASDDELRQLVRELVAARATAGSETETLA